jgi:hypothetical protein
MPVAMRPVTRWNRSRHRPADNNGSGSVMSVVFEAATGKRQGQYNKCDDGDEPFHFSTPFCILSIVLNAFLLM